MNERYNPRWVRNENRHAVGDADRESSSLLGSDVPVRLATAQPPFPAASVHEDSIAMDLPNRNQPTGSLREFPLHRTPPTHHLFDRILAGKSEGASVPGGGERADSPGLEVSDDFLGDFGQLSVGDRQRE